jgi:hypothetical protein
MSLPKQLIDSFAEINASPLVNGVITKENVQSFVDALNHAIPSSLNVSMYAIYRFNRSKYLLDKPRFVSEIKGFSPFESMILWTDFNDILAHFKLSGKIFLGWDKNKNRYRGFILSSSTEADTPVNILRKGEKLQPQVSSNTMTTLESMENDTDRVYDYMQKRMAAIAAQAKANV